MKRVELNQIRLHRDWRALSVTSRDQVRFLKIIGYLGESPATSTYIVSLHMREACSIIRSDLRRMEKLGYVTADSNGSNNIYWALRA